MSTRTLDALPTSFADVPSAVVNAGGVSGYVTKTLTVHLTTKKSIGSKLCAYLGSVVLTLPVLLLPIFVALKADGDLSWTWVHTLIPLWLLDALLFVAYLHFTRTDDTANTVVEGDINADTTSLLHAPSQKIMTKFVARFGTNLTVDVPRVQMLSLVFTVVTQVLVALRLDGQLAWKWSYISLPYCLVMIFDPSITSVLQVLQAIFVAQKLDMELSWSWAVILLPTWLPAFIIVFILPAAIAFSLLSVNEGNEQPSVVRAIAALLGLVFAFGLVFGPQLLLVLRLEYTVFDATYIILPWLILYGLLVIGGLAHAFVTPAENNIENVSVTVSYGTA
ncbi:hypothetical protein ACHHYP_15330 [Achlya hypogyna]|uniref:Transmembrane protein n=1 Tax=Achlya hypogyna TaxID=1202772 RepID=A0A1V9YB63_ACHHY|nr:hypothetical protein ACHHYP_15330 [Achlya hypogyna]